MCSSSGRPPAFVRGSPGPQRVTATPDGMAPLVGADGIELRKPRPVGGADRASTLGKRQRDAALAGNSLAKLMRREMGGRLASAHAGFSRSSSAVRWRAPAFPCRVPARAWCGLLPPHAAFSYASMNHLAMSC